MNIATALNKKYVDYTIVMLTSLCENNSVHIDAYLLNSELDENDINKIRGCLNKYDISIHSMKVNRELFSDRMPRNDMWSIETYYRLLLLDILPRDVYRLLYLDVDLIINKSLDELYNVDFGTDEIITCIDSCGKTGWEKRSKKQNEMFEAMKERGYLYFNAGVMLLNISRMREKYNFDYYLNAIEEWSYEMTAPDQDILNYVHWEHIGYVDPYEYDLFARIAHNEGMTYEQVKENAYIIHFAGEKPWNTENVHFDIEKLWWDYAKLTSVYEDIKERFIEDAFSNNTLEERIQLILDENERIKSQYNQLEEICKKIIGKS